MRKPLRKKKMLTPNVPDANANPLWVSTTKRTATALIPSNDGIIKACEGEAFVVADTPHIIADSQGAQRPPEF